ncbi:hypothetical protein Tco_1125279 [Tanacetum coccineum]|uniref:DNA-directed RNA polymerase n=1 Tax=Tanacetum coccineum TaxID=301880 RepID=A0ABQ5JCM5_9ASTR
MKTSIDSKTKLIAKAANESFDPHYSNYIVLNDLDMPLEPRMDQDDEFESTLDFVNEPTYKSCYKMKFSCMIGYRHVNADFLPILSINMITKRFYNSIIKDKGDHEGKNLAGTLIDIPIFVGNFSIILGFSIIDDMDITSGVVLGMPFCKKFVSCQKIIERFAHGDKMQYDQCSKRRVLAPQRRRQGVRHSLAVTIWTLPLALSDLAVKKSTIWYTLKKTCVELVRAILTPRQHTFAQELKIENHPEQHIRGVHETIVEEVMKEPKIRSLGNVPFEELYGHDKESPFDTELEIKFTGKEYLSQKANVDQVLSMDAVD